MLEEIIRFFEQDRWLPVSIGEEGFTVFSKAEDGGYAVVIVDSSVARDLTKEKYHSALSEVEEKLRAKSFREGSVLTLFFTSELAKYALLGDGTPFWIITPTGRIIVRTGQPEDFAGIRKELTNLIAPAPVPQSAAVSAMSSAPVVTIKKPKTYIPDGFWEESAYNLRTCFFTISLFLINVAIFYGAYSSGGSGGIEGQWDSWAKSWETTIRGGQVWRLFTCMFIHGNQMHLWSNMAALLLIGFWLERRISRKAFLAVYFGGGLFASVISILYYGVFVPERTVEVELLFNSYSYTIDQQVVLSAGASGAIMALAGAAFFRMFLGRSFNGYWPAERMLRLDIAVFVVVLVNIYIALFVEDQEGIDVSAHIGGIFGGFLVMSLVMALLYRKEKEYASY